MNEITRILKENYVEDDEVYYSHVSLIQPRGKYTLNRHKLEEFWEMYSSIIYKDKNAIFGIAEKPQNYLPVIVDVDIKVKEEDIVYETIYTEKHTKRIIEIYQSVLQKIVEDCTDQDLYCALLEKPVYHMVKNDVKYFKRGFHLQFFNLFLGKTEQEVQLIPRVLEILKGEKLFDDIGFEDSSSLIDKCCCKVPWLLYGSRKSEDMEPYRLSKIFDSRGNEITLNEAFKYYRIFNEYEHTINIKENIEHFLPRIFSIVPYGRDIKELKHGLVSPLAKRILPDKPAKNFVKLSVLDNLKIAETLISMLARFRVENRNEWMTIGWILFNIGEGFDEAFRIWNDFSALDEDNYDEDKCIYEWRKMTAKSLTIGTLKYFASIDNPMMYKKFQEEQSQKFIMDSIEGSHNDIAKVLFTEFSTNFICAGVESKIWYQFVNHIWELVDGGTSIRELISSVIADKYKEIYKKIMDENDGIPSKGENAIIELRKKQIEKLVGNLKNANYKNNIMREAMEVFYDKRFKKKLDTDPYLIAFKNGVYDLKQNYLRNGCPEDFISKALPINYIDFSEDDERVLEVYDFLEKVFPDKSVRNYFLDQASDVFVGGNRQKVVNFWTGEGNNAKSITQSIFEQMLGKLAIKFPTSLLTGNKPSSGAAYADLARAGGGVRWGIVEEPNNDELINSGPFKHLSGGDSYFARDLFEKGKDCQEIVPMFKIVVICLSGDTSINLSSGISISIEKMKDNHKILAWNEKLDGLVNINQRLFIPKGNQECVELKLQDGRTINCTPNHKFLTNENKWIEAKDIIINKTSLKMGIDNPKADDIFEDYDYKFLSYNLSNQQDRMKASALARLIGYVLTDGSLNKILYLGHLIDAENVLEDVKLLTGKTPTIIKNKKIFQIHLPVEIYKQISLLTPIQKGGKVRNIMEIPEFIFDDNCPLFLIREIVAGMFGGDGCIPGLRKNFGISPLELVASKTEEFVESLINKFTLLSTLLLKKFGIESLVSKPMKYKNYITDIKGEDKYHIFLKINKNNSILKFIENIGVRFCCHKSYRLTAIKSIINFNHYVRNINQLIINRTRELVEIYKRQHPLPIIHQICKNTGKIINIFRSTQEIQHSLGIHHTGIRSAIKRKGNSGGFKWEEIKQPKEIFIENGCKSIFDAYNQAKNEIISNYGICNEDNIIKYPNLRTYYLYKDKYKHGVVDIKSFLAETLLDKFCNNFSKKTNYSVDKNRTSLPCFNMKIISIKSIGIKKVYDINVDEPYSNFVAEGIITHNCNTLPGFRYADTATFDRVRVIPFESTFCRASDPAPDTYEEQVKQKRFPMDPNFSNKIPQLIEPFAWILLEHRKKLTVRIIPDKVLKATEKYRIKNDIYKQFIEECIISDVTKTISIAELYAHFKEWFKEGFTKQSLLSKNDIKEYFTKLWDAPETGCKWHGYRIRTLQDDIDEGKAIVLDTLPPI